MARSDRGPDLGGFVEQLLGVGHGAGAVGQARQHAGEFGDPLVVVQHLETGRAPLLRDPDVSVGEARDLGKVRSRRRPGDPGRAARAACRPTDPPARRCRRPPRRRPASAPGRGRRGRCDRRASFARALPRRRLGQRGGSLPGTGGEPQLDTFGAARARRVHGFQARPRPRRRACRARGVRPRSACASGRRAGPTCAERRGPPWRRPSDRASELLARATPAARRPRRDPRAGPRPARRNARTSSSVSPYFRCRARRAAMRAGSPGVAPGRPAGSRRRTERHARVRRSPPTAPRTGAQLRGARIEVGGLRQRVSRRRHRRGRRAVVPVQQRPGRRRGLERAARRAPGAPPSASSCRVSPGWGSTPSISRT